MQPFPHHYRASVAVESGAGRTAIISSPGLPDLESNAPAEFDGPGDQWSPETLIVAAVADCYVLTFRAIARASKLEWEALDVAVDGTLDKDERIVRFTEIKIHVNLTIPPESEPRAERILQKAEENCLVTNSLSAHVTFSDELTVVE